MNSEKNKKGLWINQVKISFSNKPMTSWGGMAVLIGKFLGQINFRYWVENFIPYEENSPNGKGIYPKIIAMFMTVLTGGRRFQHMAWWGHGREVLLKAFGVEWLPKNATVLTRFLNKFNDDKILKDFKANCQRFTKELIKKDNIIEDNLNLDSTVLTRYGKQEGARIGYNPKKRGRPSHHPLLAFLGSGYVVNVINRDGLSTSNKGAIDFFDASLKALENQVKVAWVLADSGFYEIDFIKYLESKKLKYVIAAPFYRNLQSELMAKEWQEITNGIECCSFYFKHYDSKWEKKRKYVAIRQKIGTRDNVSGKQPSLFKDLDDFSDYRYSLMITNDQDLTPEEIWRTYRPRANDENVIKSLKEDQGFEGFCLKNFNATEAAMILNALIFYNLLHYFMRNCFSAKEKKHQLKTIRPKYFIIPCVLGSESRYSILRLGIPNRRGKGKFTYIFERIRFLKLNFNCNAFGFT